jgi:hypothetical protein
MTGQQETLPPEAVKEVLDDVMDVLIAAEMSLSNMINVLTCLQFYAVMAEFELDRTDAPKITQSIVEHVERYGSMMAAGVGTEIVTRVEEQSATRH